MNKSFAVGISIAALSAFAVCATSTDASAVVHKRYYPVKVGPKPVTPPAAMHGTDLTILADQTVITVNPKGCDENEELFSGTVAVKNQGDVQAERLIVEPIVSVWIPEMLDLKDDKLVPEALKPNGIFTTDFHVGKGKIKTGRGLVGTRKVYIMADPYNKVPETNKQNNLLVRTVTLNCK